MDWVLAMDAGATATRAGLYDSEKRLCAELVGGPANSAAYGPEQTAAELVRLGRALLADRPGAAVLAAGVAGAALRAEQEALASILVRDLPVHYVRVTTDVHPLLLANTSRPPAVLAVAGTGSCVLGLDSHQNTIRIGGRGSVMGDSGSAYAVVVRALRWAAHAADGLRPPTRLQAELPRAAGVDSFDALAAWSSLGAKWLIASLAPAVAECAREGDAVAEACLRVEARALAEQVRAACARVGLGSGSNPVLLWGGLFTHSPLYQALFEEALPEWPIAVPRITGHQAVAELAFVAETPPWACEIQADPARAVSEVEGLPPTEAMPPPEARTLDELTAPEIAALMVADHEQALRAVAAQCGPIAQAVEWAAATIRNGRTLFYAGAGTSGRLGVLDASECPPTFGVEPERVVGIIAGGEAALRSSIEGEEDSREHGQRDLWAAGVQTGDLVIGIAASGTTPYVLAAIEAGRAAGAATVLLCCNPAAVSKADLTIALPTGPEVLGGSTRLKAGTATKLALNIISTGAMARAGYVHRGLMVGMRPANEKLKHRAARIIAAIAGVSVQEGGALLGQADLHIPTAILMARKGLGPREARALWESHGRLLKEALNSGL